MVKVSVIPQCWKSPFFALENDTKHHERHKYEEIIYRKAEIFTLHKVLIWHNDNDNDFIGMAANWQYYK